MHDLEINNKTCKFSLQVGDDGECRKEKSSGGFLSVLRRK
jgi:hypothetical protein